MISVAAGLIKGLRLHSPQGDQTRPSSERLRQGVFNVLRNYHHQTSITQGAIVADLFAGSGAWGIEALSAGAASVVLVENHRVALSCLRQNLDIALKSLGNQGEHPQVRLLTGAVQDSYSALPLVRIIFADPPYKKGLFKIVMGLEDQYHRVEQRGLFIFEADGREEIDFSWATQAGLQLFNQKSYCDSTVYFFVKS